MIFMKYISKSEQETRAIAKKVAAELKGGETLCLIGDLGAGKTAFTKGLARALGVKQIITSPTFVLMKNYKTTGQRSIKQLTHIDAYRLSEGRELEAIGALEYFNGKDCVTVIEWADRVRDAWPKKIIKVEFRILKGERREIEIK
jgi:tRNA threonylcarbamoyladenosine biosynthesis protein TsaE